MNDRFKFRCGITISHYDDDENDIETLLLVNNVTIYDDGEVGFDRESLKEAVKRENLSKEEERTLWNSLDEYEVFDEWYQMPADFIEQCTGLKDKNGKLIYEGDFLDYKGEVCLVFWSEPTACFGVMLQDSGYTDYAGDIKRSDLYSIDAEIIGNIHENPELLKESK